MSLKRNTIYNLVGTVLPLILSLATIPPLLRQLGDERFGIVSLVWLIFGYFGLFDLGLSKATANRLARPENQAPDRQAEIFWTALPINLLLGLAGGTLLFVAAGSVFTHLLDVSDALMPEFKDSLPWVACLLPISTISAVFVGTLESRERFLILNLMQGIGSSLTYVAPLLAIYWFGAKIDVAIAATALTRLATTLPLGVAALLQIGRQRIHRLRMSTVKDLFGYGGWVTASNVIGPVLVSIDQFMIAAVVGVKAVPHYSIPFNLSMKVLILPGALVRALFPQLSRTEMGDAKQRANAVLGALSSILAVICVPLIILADSALQLWLGKAFAEEAATVTQILLVGVWINGIAFVPFSLLQSQGRPDLTAKLHAAELLPFIAILWLLLQEFGLLGAALAWSIRVSVDTACLFWLAGIRAEVVQKIAIPFSAVALALLVSLTVRPSVVLDIAMAVFGLVLIGAFAFYKEPVVQASLYRLYWRKRKS